MKKKMLSVLLLCGMLLSTAACASDTSSDNGNDAADKLLHSAYENGWNLEA